MDLLIITNSKIGWATHSRLNKIVSMKRM